MITSRSNQQLKKARKLLSSAKERRESGLFVAEGARICGEVPPEWMEAVFLSEECRSDAALSWKRRILAGKDSGSPILEVVEKSIFRELSDTVNPQGILAIVRQPRWDLEKLLGLSAAGRNDGHEPGRILLLDGVRDPGNLGTMIRTAEAAGVEAVVMSPDCVDLYNPKVIRSTMGSIFRVPAGTRELVPFIHRLQAAGRNVYGTSLSAAHSYQEADLTQAAIVIGSEAEGISAEVADAVTDHIRIPMKGKVESLNAAISAAILMFC